MMPARPMNYPAYYLVTGTLVLCACSFNPAGVNGGDTDAATADAAATDGAVADGAIANDASVPVDAPPAPDAMMQTPTTCADLPVGSPDGMYMIDLDGPGPGNPFTVGCDMTTDGGGWTIVGRERAGVQGTFQYLSNQVGTPEGIADGSQSGLFGFRLEGHYQEFRIQWDNNSRYIQITPDEPIFENTVNTTMPVSQFATSESELQGWVSGAGGARFCRASRMSDVRPGDTSWAIKDRNDSNGQCGCSSGSWAGRGAYYGGSNNATVCGDYGGGWAGVVDDGEVKAGITQPTDTLIMVR